MNAATDAAIHPSTPAPPAFMALARISSLLQNPAKGKIPAIARVAVAIVQCVVGNACRRPPMRRMSCSPPRA